MIITESQLRKIIQEETQAVLHEQILRELREGVINEGVKDVLQGLVKKYGKKAVMTAVGGSMALGAVAPATAGTDIGAAMAAARARRDAQHVSGGQTTDASADQTATAADAVARQQQAFQARADRAPDLAATIEAANVELFTQGTGDEFAAQFDYDFGGEIGVKRLTYKWSQSSPMDQGGSYLNDIAAKNAFVLTINGALDAGEMDLAQAQIDVRDNLDDRGAKDIMRHVHQALYAAQPRL